jgi:hypothetical protein
MKLFLPHLLIATFDVAVVVLACISRRFIRQRNAERRSTA